MSEIPAIVARAMVNTITNVGQLAGEDVKILDKYVKLGYLSKGKGGCYPVIKTVWACPGFDFTKQRSDAIEKMKQIAEWDKKQKEDDLTLEEMLLTVTDENRHDLVDWGKDVGREVVED